MLHMTMKGDGFDGSVSPLGGVQTCFVAFDVKKVVLVVLFVCFGSLRGDIFYACQILQFVPFTTSVL